jgi:hypothetical protein
MVGQTVRIVAADCSSISSELITSIEIILCFGNRGFCSFDSDDSAVIMIWSCAKREAKWRESVIVLENKAEGRGPSR